MGHHYFDSSALVKRYVAETGTNWINGLCAIAAGHTLYTVRISGAEIVAALFRRAREGALAVSDAQSAATQFKADFRNRYQIVEITERLIDLAMTMARSILYADMTLFLAAALELQTARDIVSLSAITFVCADDKLNVAAVAEGLLVENPNTY